MIPIKITSDIEWYKAVVINLIKGRNNNEKKYQKIADGVNSLVSQLSNENTSLRGLTFEKLLIANFETIKKVKDQIDTKGSNRYFLKVKKYKKKVHQFPWKEFIGTYNRFSERNINNLIVSKLNLQVCPYCNRNYIQNYNKSKAGAQLDHFFDKDTYPIFALCFYNLIPCCPQCNHIKGNREIYASPYDKKIDFIKNLSFTYDFPDLDYLKNKDSIKVKVNGHDAAIKSNIDVFELNNIYSYHNDYVREILIKRTIYSDSRINEIFKNHGDLFDSEKDLFNMIFGNYIHSDELFKRPLSKLTKDICKEVGIDID